MIGRFILSQLIVVFMLGFRVVAQSNVQSSPDLPTNTFSYEHYGFLDETKSAEEIGYYSRCDINHIVMPETLPANLDTNDLWGAETNGLLLSIRLRRNKYFVGDIVPAITILRNLEPDSRMLSVTDSPSLFETFFVRSGTNAYLTERIIPTNFQKDIYTPIPYPPHGWLTLPLSARSQRELVQDLNQVFNLSQVGKYTVRAICRVYSPATKREIYEVSSRTTSFQIVDPPPPKANPPP